MSPWQDFAGRTPLHYAAQVDNDDAVRVLAEFDMPLNRTDTSGSTAAHVARAARRDVCPIATALPYMMRMEGNLCGIRMEARNATSSRNHA